MRRNNPTIFLLSVSLMALPPVAFADIDNVTLLQMNEIVQQNLQWQQSLNQRTSGPSFNEQIDEARSAFWDAYAKGPVPKEVEERSLKLLAEKDLVLMVQNFAKDAGDQAVKDFGVAGPVDKPDVGDFMMGVIVAGLDHGVRPTALNQFNAWRDVIERRRDEIQPKVNVFNAVPAAAAAIEASIKANDPELTTYLEARNRAERLAALDKLHFDTPRDYLLNRIELETNDASAAKPWIEQLEAVAGPQRIDDIAAKLKKARKDRDGLFAEPVLENSKGVRLWLTTMKRAERLAAYEDPKLYALWVIRDSMNLTWPEARQTYQKYWVDPFGEQAVLDAAEKVRAAKKTIRGRSEKLEQDIAGTDLPATALAKLMPYNPYRDKPLGSLDSTDPQMFLYALLKENTPVKHWDEVPDRYNELFTEWGEQTLMNATRQAMGADKPWEKFQEFLNRKLREPDQYFYSLARSAWTWPGNNQFQPSLARAEYKHLVDSFGQEKVSEVIAQVRDAVESKSDLTKLGGNVSGATEPLPVVYDILWSTSSPQAYLQYLSRRRTIYGSSKGDARELALAIAEKVAKSPKQLESLRQVHINYGDVLLADSASLGLAATEGSAAASLGAVDAIAQLLRARQQEMAAKPLEVGQRLSSPRFGGDAVVIRKFDGDDGVQYLLQMDRRCFWQHHDEVRRAWKPLEVGRQTSLPEPPAAKANDTFSEGAKIRVYIDGQWHNGEVVFFEGRSQPQSWAVKFEPAEDGGKGGLRLFTGNQIRERPITDFPEMFPVGSTVRLKMRSEECKGIVREFEPKRGWLVEIERPRGNRRMWIRSSAIIKSFHIELDNGDKDVPPP